MCDQHDEQQPDEPAGARYELRDDLPVGEIVVPIDTPTETVLAVHPRHMTPELVAALNHHLEHMTRHGLWRRCG